MTALAAAALAAAVLLWVPPRAARRRRLMAVVPSPAARTGRWSRWAPSGPPGPRRRWAEAAAAGGAVFLVLGVGLELIGMAWSARLVRRAVAR